MGISKIPHEISVWEDRLTIVDFDEKEYDGREIIPSDIKIMTSYFKEIKLCSIGSDEMNSPIAAYNKELKQEATGMNTLTFTISGKYYDEETNELLDNPYLPYLTNERKIKLKYYQNEEVKWMDFLIKGIQEDSNNYSYTYTATDLFINELSKTGYNLEFSTELQNNQGTITDLGNKVLEGTDWKISEDSEIIQQLQEEALYELKLTKNIYAFDIKTDAQVEIKQGEIIYAFYSSVINEENNFFQFIYNKSNEYLTDDRRVIYDADSYYILLAEGEKYSNFSDYIKYTSKYRGERLVRSQMVAYDPILEKHVKVYKDDNNNKVYGYTKDEYLTENMVQSYITNGVNYISNSGWKQQQDKIIQLGFFPEYTPGDYWEDVERKTTLKYEQDSKNVLFNSGFKDNLSQIGEITKESKFIFRTQCFLKEGGELVAPQNTCFKIALKSYQLSSEGGFSDGIDEQIIFEGRTADSTKLDPEGYFITRVALTSKLQLSEEQLKNKNFGFFITVIDQYGIPKEGTYYFQDVQLFKYMLDSDSRVCLPGGKTINLNDVNEEIKDSLISYSKTNHYYYYPNRASSKEEVKYIYIGEENKYSPLYNQNFEKIRSITEKESNRFNILQNLSETFECWCCIDVKHKDTGEIMLGKDYEHYIIDAGTSKTITDQEDPQIISSNVLSDQGDKIKSLSATPNELYKQQKFITFKRETGRKNCAGIKYGINLKNIKRNQESDEMVTKLIVKSNNNEFAQGGGCNISRAKENPSGENFILNFDYYLNQGLLNYDNFYNDLYSLSSEEGWMGYYTTLKLLNKEIEELGGAINELSQQEIIYDSEHTALFLEFEAVSKNLKEKEEYFQELTNYNFDNIPRSSSWFKEKKIIALSEEIVRLRTKAKLLETQEKQKLEKLQEIQQKISEKEDEFQSKISQKKKKISLFEKRYSRFIQEGAWSSEDYIDDNLYYLDAESVLYNSSHPKISYDIDTVEISTLEGYENYNFDIRDITYIEDPEFFGWVEKDGEKTPYKEPVVITEIVTYFDEPDKGKIRIQNYKSKFEDLFQRLTATTQKLEFQAGAYQRAANIITPEGYIQSKFLQDALAHNSAIVQNAKNQSVVWDDKGITTINTLNPAEVVRITSGGFFLSDDGGENWITGVTGKGINARTITTGHLDTQLITITNSDQTSFRWDNTGINAYYKKDGNYNNKTFVRFDQFGLYGVKDLENSEILTSEESVWRNAEFALTWKGFMLKAKDKNGYVSIDSEHDFGVYNSENEQLIQIGRLDIDDDKNYGILIYGEKDNSGLRTPIFKATQDDFQVGGWKVNGEGFHSMSNDNKFSLYTDRLKNSYTLFNGLENPIDVITRDDWAIVVGNQFGISYNGELYSNNAHIIGNIEAISGKIGDVEILEDGSTRLSTWIGVPEGFKYTGETTEYLNSDNKEYIEQYITAKGMAFQVFEFDEEAENFKGDFRYKIIINNEGLFYSEDTTTMQKIKWKSLFEQIPHETI